MNDKLLFSILLCIALIFLGIGIYFVTQPFTSDVPTGHYSELPPDTGPVAGNNRTPVQPTHSQITTVDTDNGEVRMRNPLQIQTAESMSDGLYNLPSLETYLDRDFNVIYNEANQSFAVALLKEPLATARNNAQQYLLEELGVTLADLCKLNVYVGVTSDVNEFYAGKQLGLQGCAGAAVFE